MEVKMSTGAKETVIQFGEGGFLRGFMDYFFHKLRKKVYMMVRL